MPPKLKSGGGLSRVPSQAEGNSGNPAARGGATNAAGTANGMRDRNRSQRWIDLRDDDVRRRERQLAQVEAHIRDLHHNGEYGLMSTVGPMLGLVDETVVIDEDGEILGRADKMAPSQHHPKDTRVVEIVQGMVSKVGYPDFAEVRYGLTSPGGEVFAAGLQGDLLKELVYPPVQKNSGKSGPHPKAGQTKMIGRLALRQPNKARSCRVLIMGGQAESRADFLRWFGHVEDFEFDLEAQKLQAECEAMRKSAKDEDGGATATQKLAAAEALEEALLRKADASMCFKIVATFQDAAKEDALAALRQQMAEAAKEDDDEAGSMSGSHTGGRTSYSDNTSSHDDESVSEVAQKEAREERERVRKRVERFRHLQGCHTPLSKLVEQASSKTLGADWGMLEKKDALCLVYHGIDGMSPLSRLGTFTDFCKRISNRVKSKRVAADSTSFFKAETLLSTQDTRYSSLRRPPDSFILINSPDIVRQPSGKIGEEDLVASLTDRLLPKMRELMIAMRKCDEDGTNNLDITEFSKAIDSLGMDPAISKSEVSLLFSRLDPDGGGSIEYEDLPLLFNQNDEGYSCPYDQTTAFEMIADLADVIVLLLDAKSSRFNQSELKICKAIHAKHKEKMHFACVDNHGQRDALARVLAAMLSDRSLESLPCVSTESPQILSLINTAMNPQQNQTVSLLDGLRSNIDSILKRLDRIYSKLGGDSSLVVLDPSAVASSNQLIAKACRSGSRRISKESGRMLIDFKMACKKYQKAADALLARSNIRPLTYDDRVKQWQREEVEKAAAERAVREFDVASWLSQRHVRAWLDSIGVELETKIIFERENVSSIHDLLRVREVRMIRWGVEVGDRLRIAAGLDKVKGAFAERRRTYLSEGLWQLLATEAPNDEEVTVRLASHLLQDQGPDAPIKANGLKAGQRTVVDVPTHGKLVVSVPQRTELEAKNWELKLKRMKGLDAYISAYDLSVMLAVLKGDIDCSPSSKLLLEDGLHLFLVGDIPAMLVAELIIDLRSEFEDVLGYQSDHKGLLEESRAYHRRWALDDIARAERADSDVSDSSSDEEDLEQEELLQRASERISKCFQTASEGEIVASGEALEDAVRRDDKLLKLLDRAGTEMKLGSVRIFREKDVLLSEVMRALLGDWDVEGNGSESD